MSKVFKVRFDYHGRGTLGYGCVSSGDNSGVYVRESDYANLEAERDALKNELSLAQASLRCCYNAAAGTLGLATSDSQKAR